MATIYKRGNVYWAQVHHKGKRRRKSLDTKNYGQARVKAAAWEKQFTGSGEPSEPTRTHALAGSLGTGDRHAIRRRSAPMASCSG